MHCCGSNMKIIGDGKGACYENDRIRSHPALSSRFISERFDLVAHVLHYKAI